MQHTPQRATAIACLLRAVIALLATRPYALALIDWGRELHDRFALPFYLQADLDAVLADLEAAGLGLERPIQDVLRQDEAGFWARWMLLLEPLVQEPGVWLPDTATVIPANERWWHEPQAVPVTGRSFSSEPWAQRVHAASPDASY
jgi:hypothetical protein